MGISYGFICVHSCADRHTVMFLLLLYFILQVIYTEASNGQTALHHQRRDKDIKEFITKPLVSTNQPYIDRGENLYSVPKFQIDNHKTKKKVSKKSAKRTIQKIIKKGKAHKKPCHHLHTSLPTKPPMNDDMDSLYAKEEESQKKKENLTMTHVKEKKKRKWENRVSRYPMPFHKMKPMKEHRRNKRSDERDNLFVLTDLDEIEFLDNNDKDMNDTDIVSAHVKKYWQIS